MLERIGKTENTLEAPEMKELSQILKLNEQGMTDIGMKAEKVSKLSMGYVEGLFRLSETLGEFERTTSGFTTEKGLGTRSIGDVAQSIRQLAEIQSDLTQVIVTVMNSVRAFVKDDIASARLMKKKYDTSRAELQTVLTELQAVQGKSKTDFKKLTEAEAKRDSCEEAFKGVSNEALGIMSETQKSAEIRALTTNLALWEGIRNFFQSGKDTFERSASAFEGHATSLPKLKEELSSMKATRTKTGRPVFTSGLKQRSSVIFGVALESVIEREGSVIPRFVSVTTKWLLEHGGKVEGIFRISPMAESLRTYKTIVDRGTELPDYPDAHVAAGLLKQYLRDLPDPLLTHALFSDFLSASKINLEEPMPVRIAAMKKVVDRLPECSYRTLGVLLRLLHRLSWHEVKTKMGATNLAVVVAPNILYSDIVDPFSMVESMSDANVCVTLLVQAFPQLFPEIDLFPLVEANNLSELRRVPPSIVDFTLRNRSGETLLHVAARSGAEPALITFLLAADLAVDARNDREETPLMLAIADDAQHIATAKALVEAGADPVLVDSNGQSALDRSRHISPNLGTQIFSIGGRSSGIGSTPPKKATASSPAAELAGSASSGPTLSGWRRASMAPNRQSIRILGVPDLEALQNSDSPTRTASQTPQSPSLTSVPESPRAEPLSLETSSASGSSSPSSSTSSSSSSSASSSSDVASSSSSASLSAVPSPFSTTSTSSAQLVDLPTPSSTTPMLAISQTDLDDYCPSLDMPAPLFEQSTVNQLIRAVYSFAQESSKPLGNVTGDSPVFLALKHLGAQFQKTRAELLTLAKEVEQSSQANAAGVIEKGNELPPLIKAVIGGIQAYSKGKDEASKRALGQALLDFLDPTLSLFFHLEKCGISAVMKGQKDLFENLHQLLSLSATAQSGDAELQNAIEAAARNTNLLVFVIRRRALTLPADTGVQYSLFDSCVTIENSVSDFIKCTLEQTATQVDDRELTQLKALTRVVFFEFPQILGSLGRAYPEHCFKFNPLPAATYEECVQKAESLIAKFQACKSTEVAPFVPLLSPLPAALKKLSSSSKEVSVVVETASLFSTVTQRTADEIMLMIKDIADNRGVYRHFSVLIDALRFHDLNIDGSAAAHLARLLVGDTSPSDVARPDMDLPHALAYYLEYYGEITNALLVVFSFDN